jgi:glycosyltransferase involved in cell wall biosynthesis
MADLSTMAKTVEYLARGVPVVAANLQETRYSAGDAGVYVPTGTADEYAKVIDELLDDETTLATMRTAALERFRTVLAWEHQARTYVGAWNDMLAVTARA